MRCALRHCLQPFCGLTKCMATAPSLISTMEMQGISPGVLQALGSQSHQQRIVATDLLMSDPRTTTATLLDPPCEVRVSQEPRRVCVWEPAGPVVTNVRPLRALVSQRCRVYTMPGCA